MSAEDELGNALAQNAAAIANGRTPPFGVGAIEILRRRVADEDGRRTTRTRTQGRRRNEQPVTSPVTPASPAPDERFAILEQLDLSEREREVLALLASRGLRTRELAVELYIGAETVKSHLKSIYRKLGVSSRAEAIAFVLRSDEPVADGEAGTAGAGG